MNPRIREALAEAGWTPPPGVPEWRNYFMVYNYSAIPHVAGLSPDFRFGGFKLILLDGDGRPAQFCRCADSTDSAFARETQILERLSADPELRDYVPRTRGGSSGTISVQLGDYIQGRSYQVQKDASTVEQWRGSVGTILDMAYRIGARAMEIVPGLATTTAPLELQAEAGASIAELRSDSAFAPEALTAAEAALSTVPAVPRHVQHGDLWPGNAIFSGGTWRLIDFGDFGKVGVPLYDVFQMVQTSYDTRLQFGPGGSRDSWTLEAVGMIDHWADRYGLTREQTEGTLLFYLLHSTAHRIRPGTPAAAERQARDDLNAALETVRLGKPLLEALDEGLR